MRFLNSIFENSDVQEYTNNLDNSVLNETVTSYFHKISKEIFEYVKENPEHFVIRNDLSLSFEMISDFSKDVVQSFMEKASEEIDKDEPNIDQAYEEAQRQMKKSKKMKRKKASSNKDMNK